MKVLLLAPPGRQRYVRDYYCSKVAKAGYSYAPVDLLLLSGRFEDVILIDAIRERLKPPPCLERIRAEAPDAIITLTGSVSWPEDRIFLNQIKQVLPRVSILASGDVLLEDGSDLLRNEHWLDGILLDFTNADAAHYLKGEYQAIEQMIFRDDKAEIIARISDRRPGSMTDLPQPRHEIFLNQGYAYPFVRHRAFATVQTDYGCPYTCRFCVMGSLGHRVRSEEEVISELETLKGFGIRDIYFNDQTFGGTRSRLVNLCRAFIQADLNLGWCCWNRVDLVSDLLELMKQAGCHTIMFGIDSAHDATLMQNRKGYTIAQVRETLSACHRLGIRTLGTFLLGLPGESSAMVQQSIDFALELDPDFVSFNVYVPRKGTALRKEMADIGRLPGDEVVLDQSGAFVGHSAGSIGADDLKQLRDKAVRRFYGRPAYLWRRLKSVRTKYDMETLIRMAVSMI